MKPNAESQEIIRQLMADFSIIGKCPECGSSYPMKEWHLFYDDNFPEIAQPFVDMYVGQARAYREEYERAKQRATKGAEKTSLAVNFGKNVERIAPILSGFPFHPNDCRGLFDPIDYVVFEGLYEKGEVTSIKFLDIKTGNARLSDHQKWVKEAVDRGKVRFAKY